MKKRLLMFAAALLTLGAGVASAAIPNTTDYLHKTSPMISGTVFSVDDRQIVVDTDQDQRVTLVMDTRTMLPTDLAPGMKMRAEFRVMENGQYYVSRIIPMRDGTDSPKATAYQQDRENTSSDADRNATTTATTTTTQSTASTELVSNEAPVAADPVRSDDRPTSLPQTASNQPLIGLLGLVGLGAAGALMMRRRLSRV